MSTNVEAPTPPAQPTALETANDFSSAFPAYFETALEYEPQLADLERQINERLYPQTAGIQEQLAGQASRGMSEAAPDWYMNKSQDYIKSLLGTNVASPMGANAYSTGMMEQQKNWNDYYRNLGLSVTSRQPLAQSANLMQSYTPQTNMTNQAQNYGTYSNLYGNMYDANSKTTQSMNAMYGQIGGGLMGGLGYGMMGGMGGGASQAGNFAGKAFKNQGYSY